MTLRIRILACTLWALALAAAAQSVTTATVQGTVYSAGGAPVSGTLQLSWPAFTTAAGQAIAAGRINVTIGADGFFSVNLAPNQGASPAGLYYTAVYYLSDGATSTEYWTVPAAAQATLAQVRAQVMPAAQAVQAVSKAYVDQAIQQAAQSQITPSGGTLTGPLYLSGDPTAALQAADKQYVDKQFSQAVPIEGGVMTGPITATRIGAAYQVDQFKAADFGASLQACINGLDPAYGGICDARNFSGTLAMASPLDIATANITVQLPCATIATANPIVIAPGTRNVTLHGCATRGTSSASGSQGGTVFLYSGSAALFQVGDSTYSGDTLGFHLDNVVINTTAATTATAQALAAWRTQEMHLDSLYLLGNSNQTALTLDGTGNYTGGAFSDIEIGGYLTGVNAIGHQVTNSATTDWLNASTFLRLHIDCPTSGGNPIAGTIGINLQQGDGNTFTGGDVEGCATALHLGPDAQNNTIVGLRNENSTNQVVADAGSAYNNWTTGGTMFLGKLTDNGTHNTFWDAFHRAFNTLNGDLWRSQADATVTNHIYTGIGLGAVRGRQDEWITDLPGVPGSYRNAWLWGPGDGAGGSQLWQLQDMINNVTRFGVGQLNTAGGNNQSYLNAAGTGLVCFNCSTNSGTGGVSFGSGGAAPSTVATIDKSGNANFTGTLQVGGASQSSGNMTVRNNADAEVDYYLWPGLTTSQHGSFTYKDWNGASQWYLVKDQYNNWAVNSAVGGLDSFKAYQSTNSGDTYVNASKSSGVVRVNYESGSGSAFKIYGGNSSTLYESFTAANSWAVPGLAASSGHNCLQIDNSGYISNTGAACSTGGTVNSGILGQIAYYTATGAVLAGITAVPVANGGTGASDPATAIANLGALPVAGGAMNGPLSGTSASFSGAVAAATVTASVNTQFNVMAAPYNAKGDCVTDDQAAIQAALNAAYVYNSPTAVVYFPKPPGGCYLTSALTWQGQNLQGQPGVGNSLGPSGGVTIKGKPGQDILRVPDPSSSTLTSATAWSISDLQFELDDTVDASSSFPHRWPGKWVGDAAMTSGSATLTSGAAGFLCDDVGEAVLVKGAGVAGADLSTTISSVPSCTLHNTTATLAASASSTVGAARAYIAPIGLSVTDQVGNAAIAADNYDANSNNWLGTARRTWQSDRLNRVSFVTVSGNTAGQNHVAAIWTQGVWTPYGMDARGVYFNRYYYGLVEGMQDTNPAGSASANVGTGADYQSWDTGVFNGTKYPWIIYNGGFGRFVNFELTGQNGPQFEQVGSYGNIGPTQWFIDNPEFESSGGSTGVGYRFDGSQSDFARTELTNGGAYPHPYTYIMGYGNRCFMCTFINGQVEVGGFDNIFQFKNGLGDSRDLITDVGYDNKLTGDLGAFSSNPGFNTQKAVSLIKMRDAISGLVTRSFVDTGNVGSPYWNASDLFIWPQDIRWKNGIHSIVNDSTSLVGKYVQIAGGTDRSNAFAPMVNSPFSSNGQYNISNSASGATVPPTKVIVYFAYKCPADATTTIGVRANDTQIAGGSVSCSTSWQVGSVTADLTSYAGGYFGITAGSTNETDLGWVAVRPFQADYNGQQPVLKCGSITTTAGFTPTSLSVAFFTTAGIVTVTPTNSSGATLLKGGYYITKSSGTIDVNWQGSVAGGETFDIGCSLQ